MEIENNEINLKLETLLAFGESYNEDKEKFIQKNKDEFI